MINQWSIHDHLHVGLLQSLINPCPTFLRDSKSLTAQKKSPPGGGATSGVEAAWWTFNDRDIWAHQTGEHITWKTIEDKALVWPLV